MKPIRITLTDYLMKTGNNGFISIKTAFSHLYINKDLIRLMDRIICTIPNQEDKYRALLNLKRLIKQVPRKAVLLDQSMIEELCQHLLDIKEDQRVYNPLKWVEAELEFIDSERETWKVMQDKTWWTFNETLRLFGIKKSTLYLRISNGLPFTQFGGSIIFFPDVVIPWIKENGI